jgi:hypothetical protein
MTHDLNKTNEKQEKGETPKKQDNKILKRRLGLELNFNINSFVQKINAANNPNYYDELFAKVEAERIIKYKEEKSSKNELYRDITNNESLNKVHGQRSFSTRLNFDDLDDLDEGQGPSYTDIVKQLRRDDRSPGM